MTGYQVLSHTADAGIEATAKTLPMLLETLAYGMFDLMFDIAGLESSSRISIEVSSGSTEDLVFDVLSELLYRAEIEGLVLVAFDVESPSPNLARVVADGAGAGSVELRGPPIKAVTYHELAAVESDDGWYGRVIFDV